MSLTSLNFSTTLLLRRFFYLLLGCSLNLGVVLCLECAGVHRGLGVHISQCRSFKLDVMDESILSMFASLGNELANAIWEENMGTTTDASVVQPVKPTPSSSREDKERHVKNKYVLRKYVVPNSISNQENIEKNGSLLIDAAAKGDMQRLLNHVAWKTDLDYVSEHGATALSAAAHRGKYSKRRRSNVAVIIVSIIFISSFLFYCLLLNHSFPTNPNRMTNCFQLFLSVTTLQLHCSCVRYFDFLNRSSCTYHFIIIKSCCCQ